MKVLFVAVLLLLQGTKGFAQGCVAIRGGGSSCMLTGSTMNNNGWQFSAGARYFKSFRHFSGTEENKDRLIQNTEVINHTGILDLGLTKFLNNRWSVMVNAPVISNARSSLYEHGLVNGAYVKRERHTMHSFGLGDLRLAVLRWMIDPSKHPKGNVQLGLGLKLPTGDYDYKDYWYNVGPNGSKELRTVDQSIQLGDGGTGLTFEANGFYQLNHSLGFYGNVYYLSNPREHNGVRTYRETLTPNLANEAIMSVPDQYMVRGGVSYMMMSAPGLTFAAGGRIEGIPVRDLIGGSGEFRRPGYVVSVEPAANYQLEKMSFFISVPVALSRNRLQSITDIENSEKRGTFVRGDAAFADYSVNAGVAFRFN